MNENHMLETILTEIGSSPIPQDVDQLAEGIVNEFRQSLSAEGETDSAGLETPPTAVQQEELNLGDNRMNAQDTSRPAARLVPDVPTDLADGDPRGSHPTEEPSSQRHSPWRFVTMFQRRTVRWSAVAAVIVITFVGVGSWLNLGDGRSGVVWADVVEQIRTVTTMSYEWTHMAVKNPGRDSEETQILQRGRSYLQDPGKRRSEVLDDNGEIGWIAIESTSGNSRSTMVYDPAESKWEKSTISGVAVQEGEVHRTAFTWMLLQDATSEQALKLGEKAIDGRPAAGFRATLPLENMSALPPLIGTFEVWVDQVTAIPIQVVAIFQQDRGSQEDVFERLVMQNIEWNTPLDDALFQLPEGARTDELELGPVRFSGAQLKDGITLWLGPKGGTPVVTQKDISQVAYGQTSVERVDGDETYRTVVGFDVNQDGQARLRKHTREHINEKLLIDFNGDIIYEPTIRSEIGSRFVIVLCESETTEEHESALKEFEEKYLSNPQESRPPANVLFSAPGRYHSADGELFVEVIRKPDGHVSYAWGHASPAESGEVSSKVNYPLRERDLVMCWDAQGRLWTYHPAEFVHYHQFVDNQLRRVFVGSGAKVREEMPSVFRDSLPKDIEDMLTKQRESSPDGVLQIPLNTQNPE